MRVFLLTTVLTSASAFAGPMIDDTPTRVQTSLAVDMELVGTLRPKAVGEISTSRWTIDCAGLDREHASWETVREYLVPLGIARMRQQAGWARCEKDPGVYDFAWLDRPVLDGRKMGVSTWLELSYGNPAYPGGGGRQLAAGMPTSREGLAAWYRWVERTVRHYKGVVSDFCIWNEPDLAGNNDPVAAADFAIRTAEIIRREIPDARIAAFALNELRPAFVRPLVEELERRGKTGLFTSIAYHHYVHNPDDGYERIDECRQLIAAHAPSLKLWEGEGGTLSEWCGSGALSKCHWSELTQAKYDLRRALGDLGHDDDTSVFHICDLEYRTSGFHDGLVRYGLLKTSGQADGFRMLKVKMAYYAVQNAVSVFNDAMESLADKTTSRVRGEPGRRYAVYDWKSREDGMPLAVFWDATEMPREDNGTRLVNVEVSASPFPDPVWVDVLTGNAYRIHPTDVRREGGKTVYAVPAYDSPAFVTDRSLLTLDKSWFAEAADGFRTLPRRNVKYVEKADFFGPFAKGVSASTAADLRRLGAARAVAAPFSLRPSEGPWPERGRIPDLTGFLSFSVTAEKAGPAWFYWRNDWFGDLFVNGERQLSDLEGDPEKWNRRRIVLSKGANELVFRTSPGSGGKWTVELAVDDIGFQEVQAVE